MRVLLVRLRSKDDRGLTTYPPTILCVPPYPRRQITQHHTLYSDIRSTSRDGWQTAHPLPPSLRLHHPPNGDTRHSPPLKPRPHNRSRRRFRRRRQIPRWMSQRSRSRRLSLRSTNFLDSCGVLECFGSGSGGELGEEVAEAVALGSTCAGGGG